MGADLSPNEQRLLAADDREIARTGTWLAAIFSFIGSSIIILLVQSIMWLKSGQWPDFTIQTALDWLGIRVPVLSWAGAQHVLISAMWCPVSGASFAIGIALIFVFTRNDRHPVQEDLRTARMKRARLSVHTKN